MYIICLYDIMLLNYVCPQHQVCIQSVTVVLDEDVSHQITLTREGEVIIGVHAAPALPYIDGRNLNCFKQ